MATRTTLDKTLKRLHARKVMTMEQLASLMQCSRRTVQRYLKQWRAINSFNKNGRYYVLPAVPSFDPHGLWHHRDIGFSRYGNLTETLIHLVRNSPAGLNATELGRLLRMEPRSFLSPYRSHPALKREKHQGRWVYFSAESDIHPRQQDQRRIMADDVRRPTDSEVIAILVEAIRHPQSSSEQLCRQLNKQGLTVTERAVAELFAEYGLALKKTPDSR